MKKFKKHAIINKPFVGTLLLIVSSYFLPALASLIFADQGALPYFVCIGCSILFLVWYRFTLRPNFAGILAGQSLKSFGQGMLYCSLLLLIAFMNFISGVNFNNFTLELLGMAIYAGVCEEITFRALPVTNLMRIWLSEKRILPAIILPSVLFGALHISNILAGAGFKISIVQSIYATALGILLSAAFVRSGNILPCMIMHFLIDFIALMSDEFAASGGVDTTIVENFFEPQLLVVYFLSAVCVVISLILVRKSKREEIVAMWRNKCDGTDVM